LFAVGKLCIGGLGPVYDVPSPKSHTKEVDGPIGPKFVELVLKKFTVNGPHESILVNVNDGIIESPFTVTNSCNVSLFAVQPFGFEAINVMV
jgi:hypothetical protein